MCQIAVERPFDRLWPSQIRKVASLSAQALTENGGRGWHRHVRRWSTLSAVHGAGNTVEGADGPRPHAVVAYGGRNTREVNHRERSVVGHRGEAQGGRGR